MYVEYNANNSGGHWWLKDKDWKALEKAGWTVMWATQAFVYTEGNKGDCVRLKNGMPKLRLAKPEDGWQYNKDGRHLGAIAKYAFRECEKQGDETPHETLVRVAREWEEATGQVSTEPGCACCGQPHNFTLYDAKGKWLAHGPEIHTEGSW
jgi:hypothetical protein